MQRATLLLSGAGAAAAGQRRGPRAPPPALSPGGACALHDVSRAAVRLALGHAGGGVCLGGVGGGRSCRRQEQQQELKHRGPETEGQKARGGARTVTCRCARAAAHTHNTWTLFILSYEGHSKKKRLIYNMNNTNCEIELKPARDAGCNQDEPEVETFVQDKTSSEYVMTQLGRSTLVRQREHFLRTFNIYVISYR